MPFLQHLAGCDLPYPYFPLDLASSIGGTGLASDSQWRPCAPSACADWNPACAGEIDR